MLFFLYIKKKMEVDIIPSQLLYVELVFLLKFSMKLMKKTHVKSVHTLA